MKRHVQRISGAVNNWHLLAVIIVFMLISAAALRQNNLEMGRLREAVIAADEVGDDLQEPITELRDHIFGHMNTQMGQPLNLVGSFNRAVEQARAEAEANAANPEIYREAQEICENPAVALSVRAQCIADYVVENAPEGADPTELTIPPKELYIIDYQSPAWSPDVAGWSLVITAAASTLLVGRIAWAKIRT